MPILIDILYPCGSELAREGILPETSPVTDTPHSRASSLPPEVPIVRALLQLGQHLGHHRHKEIHALASGAHWWLDLEDVQVIPGRLHEDTQLSQAIAQVGGFLGGGLQRLAVADQL